MIAYNLYHVLSDYSLELNESPELPIGYKWRKAVYMGHDVQWGICKDSGELHHVLIADTLPVSQTHDLIIGL